MTRALFLSGGAFKGYFQLPILKYLNENYHYDAIYGVSVGSINGALFAQNELNKLFDFWDSAHHFTDFFSNRYYFPFNGLYSMNPLRKKIETNLSLSKMQMNFISGFTSFTDGKYRNVQTKFMKKDSELWDAVQASSCIAGLMIPPKINIDDQEHIGCDGGYRNIIPISKEKYDNCDIIVCEPIYNSIITTDNNSRFIFDLISTSVEIFQYEIFKRDLERFKNKNSGKITLYAPQNNLGKSFSLDDDIMNFRYNEGIKSINNPIYL